MSADDFTTFDGWSLKALGRESFFETECGERTLRVDAKLVWHLLPLDRQPFLDGEKARLCAKS